MKGRILRWAGAGLKHAFGALCWIILLNVLAVHTRFDAWSAIDGLWMKELHDGLARNAIGELAYRGSHGDFGSGTMYVYLARYHPDSEGRRGQPRSLTSLVDVATFRQIGADGAMVSYRDAKHEYRVLTTSDGTEIFVDQQK